MRISVIGTGHLGLVSGVCLAEKGHQVACVDIDHDKIELINNVELPIYEPGLDKLLEKNIYLTFWATTDLKRAVMNTDLSIIAVDTPFGGDKIDLNSIRQATADVGNVLRQKDRYHVVVIKSTVTPGTTEEVVLPILEETSGKKAGQHFGVGMNPEFLREGEAIDDFMNPDRIILGGIDDRTQAVMEQVYQVFEGVDIIKTNNKTAEMTKYTANSLLATLISFSNEIGNLCAVLGNIDVVEVMEGVYKDKRFSPILIEGKRLTPGFISYLAAGCGFGGSCFPKDVKALIAYGRAAGNDMSLLESVIETNENQPNKVISLLQRHFRNLKGLPVSILGLAFKPGTDDMRESPAIPVIQYLINAGAKVQAYDPAAIRKAEKFFDNTQIEFFKDINQCIKGTEAVILLTKWEEFEQVPELIQKLGSQPLFIDGRRMLPKERFKRYEGIGLS